MENKYHKSRFIDYDLHQMVKKYMSDCNELCSICNADETKAGKRWLRYELCCGHKYHAKCLRKLCFEKMVINCPQCGYIKPIYKNKYCSNCDIFTHPTKECDKQNKPNKECNNQNTFIRSSCIIDFND